MTERQTRTLKGVGGATALAIFVAGANWAVDTKRHEDGVTRSAFVADSIRVVQRLDRHDERFDDLLSELRDANQRLREICVATRAGCR
jgi:hypothetical protein